MPIQIRPRESVSQLNQSAVAAPDELKRRLGMFPARSDEIGDKLIA